VGNQLQDGGDLGGMVYWQREKNAKKEKN